MKLELNDLYTLDESKEWYNFYILNTNKFSDDNTALYFDSLKLFCKLGYYPIHVDNFTLRLFKNNAIVGGNTVDLLNITLIKPIQFSQITLDSTLYNELLRYVMPWYKIKIKKIKDEIPSFIKKVISFGYRVIKAEKGTAREEWSLFKKEKDIISYWRIKLDNLKKPIFSQIFTIPIEVIHNIITTTVRQTDKEEEYVKYYGLLNKRELLECELGHKLDTLKSIKTLYFENLNRIESYFTWLKENKLEDNLENAGKYHAILLQELKKEEELLC